MRDLHFNPPTAKAPDPRDELLADATDARPTPGASDSTGENAAPSGANDVASFDVSVFASDALPVTAAAVAEAAIESHLIASRSSADGLTMSVEPRRGPSGATFANTGRGRMESLKIEGLETRREAFASPIVSANAPSEKTVSPVAKTQDVASKSAVPKFANTARVRPVFDAAPEAVKAERDDDATPLAVTTDDEQLELELPEVDGLAVAGGSDPVRPRSGAWWAVPLMCAGLALIAAALLIPAADENRRLAYEMEKIQRDVEYFERQSAVNKDFLDRIGNDPALVERLAQRQLRRPRENTRLIKNPAPDDTFAMSPAALVAVDPPAPMPPYTAPVGRIAEWCRDPKLRLYLLGGAAFAVAAGVVLGSPTRRTKALPAMTAV